MLSRPSPPLTPGLPNYENVQHQMTQGQFRAAASHAKVSTIPDDSSVTPHSSGMTPHNNVMTPYNNVMSPQHNSTYMPMGLRKTAAQTSSTPLATSSPSGIPRYTPSVK